MIRIVFYFEKGLNGQIHSSPDPLYLIKKSPRSKISHSPSTTVDFLPPPRNAIWKTLQVTYSGYFWHTVNYTTSGYMLNADGHLME